MYFYVFESFVDEQLFFLAHNHIAYIITANIVQSVFNQVPTVLSQFPVTASFGNLINVQSVMDSRIDIKEGLYSEYFHMLNLSHHSWYVFQYPQ
jgi:hypothetical protein